MCNIFLICVAIMCLTIATISIVSSKEIRTVVLKCEKAFYLDEYYQDKAGYYLSKHNIDMFETYNNEAFRYGSYKYNIIIEIDDYHYSIVRSKPYEIGETIIVTKLRTVSGTTYN